MLKTTKIGLKTFLFRELPQNILIRTASDRYAGWIGQIYSGGRYEKGITRRSHKVGDKTFNEETLPVDTVADYFEHFPVLEIDYTFYRLLLEKDDKPSQNFQFGGRCPNVSKDYFVAMADVAPIFPLGEFRESFTEFPLTLSDKRCLPQF